MFIIQTTRKDVVFIFTHFQFIVFFKIRLHIEIFIINNVIFFHYAENKVIYCFNAVGSLEESIIIV